MAATAIAALTVWAGVSVPAGVAARAAPAAACATVSAPMIDVPPRSDSEPAIRVPLPRGWEVASESDPANTSVRTALLNPDLATAGFTPNAVVAVTTVSADAGTAGQILQVQEELLATKVGAAELTTTRKQVCGLPAMTATYTAPATKTAPPRRAATLVVVDQSADATYIATVTVQAVSADKGTYAQDVRTILDGLQVIPAN